MKVLKRGEIAIVKSNLKENTPLFIREQAYKKGDVVRFEKSLFEATNDTTRNEPSNTAYWKWVGTSNEWACFDYYLNTAAKAENSIELEFSCIGAMGLYINGIKARVLEIEVIDTRTGSVIEQCSFRLFAEL